MSRKRAVFTEWLVAFAVIGTAVALVLEHRAVTQLRRENDSLQQQLAQLRADNERLAAKPPRLPAPLVQVNTVFVTNTVPAESTDFTNLYSRLYDRLKDKQVKLTPEQVEAYLRANGRNATTLLAAFRTSGDAALLKEAVEKYPNDPQVNFEAVARNLMHAKDVSPAEQRQSLDAFEKAAPDNALANYLSAANYFKAGQIDQGVQELAAASTKSLDDYSSSRAENDVEAFMAAGYPMADASVLGTSQLTLPQLAPLKQMAQQASSLANTYQQGGDTESAQTMLQMADRLGQQYANPTPGEPLINELVGIAIEKIALTGMDPNAPYGDGGGTVQDRLNQLTQQRADIRQVNQQVEATLPSMSDQDWILYKNHWLMFGEKNAENWVLGKYGGK